MLKKNFLRTDGRTTQNYSSEPHKNRCFKLEILYMAIREKEKLRNLGMVFKPSLKCLKN